MTLRAKATHNCAETMREVVFELEIEVSDKTPLEQLEASAKNLLSAVSDKAREWDDAQYEDDDGEDWKEKAKA